MFSEMKRDYQLGSKTRLSDGSQFPRFSPELVSFLKARRFQTKKWHA